MRNGAWRSRSPAAGFTLVELLLAIVLLLVGIISVAQLVPASIESNFRNRYDSTSLIIAQRQLEQMVEQELDVGNPLGSTAVASAPYFFTYTAPNGAALRVDLGQAPPLFLDAALTPPPPPVVSGAELVPGTLNIDWTQTPDALPPNYWNRFATADGYIYETRWNVLTVYGNLDRSIRPVAKRVIISTRGSYHGRGLVVPTTLMTWTGQQ